jgi:hypothetical protein
MVKPKNQEEELRVETPDPPYDYERFKKHIDTLQSEQVNKLAEIIAVKQNMERTATEKPLTTQEAVKTADEIKRTLPEQPQNLIFKMMRNSFENKIEKQGQVADKHKAQIVVCNKQSNELQGKIDTLSNKLKGYEKSNQYLNSLNQRGIAGFITGLTVGSNNRHIAKLEKQITTLEKQQEKVNARCEIAQGKLDEREANIERLCDKINRINDVKDLPKAVLCYFLAEVCKSAPETTMTEQTIETAQKVAINEQTVETVQETVTPEPSAEQETSVHEQDVPLPEEPTINLDEIDIEHNEPELNESNHEQELDEQEQDDSQEL